MHTYNWLAYVVKALKDSEGQHGADLDMIMETAIIQKECLRNILKIFDVLMYFPKQDTKINSKYSKLKMTE